LINSLAVSAVQIVLGWETIQTDTFRRFAIYFIINDLVDMGLFNNSIKIAQTFVSSSSVVLIKQMIKFNIRIDKYRIKYPIIIKENTD